MFLPLLLNRFSMVGLSVIIFSSPNFAMIESRGNFGVASLSVREK